MSGTTWLHNHHTCSSLLAGLEDKLLVADVLVLSLLSDARLRLGTDLQHLRALSKLLLILHRLPSLLEKVLSVRVWMRVRDRGRIVRRVYKT